MSVPLAEQITEEGEPLPHGISFELLSKPVQELTDFDLIRIANDLRAKRRRFLQGQADRPGRTAAPRKIAATPEEKAARTEHLRTQLKLGDLEI